MLLMFGSTFNKWSNASWRFSRFPHSSNNAELLMATSVLPAPRDEASKDPDLTGSTRNAQKFPTWSRKSTEPTSTSFPLTSFDKEGLSMAWNENKKIKDCKTKSTMTRKPKRILYRNMYASVIVFYWCALTWLPLRLHYDVKHRPMVPGLK